MPTNFLEIENISKTFGPTRAVVNVSFGLNPGEVLALIGENGAGKSTVVKMLTGIYKPDSGSISVDGKTLSLSSPQDAARAGITAIHQETVMFDELSVAENLFAGNHPTTQNFFAGGLVNWKQLLEDARKVLERIEAKIEPETTLNELSVAQKHLVQIARALSQDSSVVIMDEPTAPLTPKEVGTLFTIARRLRDEGRSIIYISHRLSEVRELCDRVTIFRDGCKIATDRTDALTDADIIRLMIGRKVKDYNGSRIDERRSNIALQFYNLLDIC